MVQPVKQEDYEQYPELHQEMQEFDEAVKEHIGSFDENLILQNAPDEVETPIQEPLQDGMFLGDIVEPDEQDAVDARGFDPLIQAEVILPHNADGNFIGRAHKNPLLDSRVYEIEFLDSEHQEVSYNLLAEHLLSQVDEEGNQFQLFKEIVDHRKDPKLTVEKDDQFYVQNGRQLKKKLGPSS
jgi:hypothetical protein